MATVKPPKRRMCERCGRQDVWDDEQGAWVAAEVDGKKEQGRPHCLHEWDITGTYSPLTEE